MAESGPWSQHKERGAGAGRIILITAAAHWPLFGWRAYDSPLLGPACLGSLINARTLKSHLLVAARRGAVGRSVLLWAGRTVLPFHQNQAKGVLSCLFFFFFLHPLEPS